MSTALHEPPDLAGAGHGSLVARRAVIRWAWRLSRREWRQQILVVALLAVAVAGTIVGVAAAASAPADPNTATHGTASSGVVLPGADPHLAADIAAIGRQDATGPVEVIENKTVAVPGSVATVDLRAQDPDGRYGRPMLALVSGRYPHGPGEVAVTSGVAAEFGLRTGGSWSLDGRALRVTGVVENPANLRDQFALVAPGQISHPDGVTVLFDAGHCAAAQCAHAGMHLPGGAQRLVGQPIANNAGVGLTPADLALVLGTFGLIFIGLVAVAGFTVMAQRRLRALGMLAAVGATDRDLRLVMIASGAAAGVAGALAGAALGLGGWLLYAPRLQASVGHVIDPFALPWPLVAIAMAPGGGDRRGRRLAARPRGRPGPGRGGHVRAAGPARRRPPPRRPRLRPARRGPGPAGRLGRMGAARRQRRDPGLGRGHRLRRPRHAAAHRRPGGHRPGGPAARPAGRRAARGPGRPGAGRGPARRA